MRIKLDIPYNQFVNRVDFETATEMCCWEEKHMFRTNPVNLLNINGFKKQLQNIYDDPIVEDALQTKTPKQFFETIMENFDELSAQVVAALTPKSKRPKVIEMERLTKELGIKSVNFSDDIKSAKNIFEGVKELIKHKIPLPDEITTTRWLPYSGRVYYDNKRTCVFLADSFQTKYQSKLNAKTITMATGSESFKSAPKQYRKQYLDEIRQKFKEFLNKNPNYVFFHEMGHTFPSQLSDEVIVLSKHESALAAQISDYAANNGDEIMPEMFAKLMCGNKLTPEQLQLYIKLGGIVPV